MTRLTSVTLVGFICLVGSFEQASAASSSSSSSANSATSTGAANTTCVIDCLTNAVTSSDCKVVTNVTCACLSVDVQRSARDCLLDQCESLASFEAAAAIQDAECASVTATLSSINKAAGMVGSMNGELGLSLIIAATVVMLSMGMSLLSW
ncbi:hypothetical protein BT96DRAFT_209031 [Gymnopus androsaceus JB14]|uniref:CFEM domain-containing protein n=1 Tax=Gymnopus androsaceus JB14 TaxID=1447944 RepID=A0A6A4I7X2_9AGAR|nr:hypothetical protein BT96DRAFT_209031 [Gymnopus androsaceus JB14]